VVSGCDDRQRDEQWPQRGERLGPAAAEREREREADRGGEAGVQAGDGGERVVEDRRAAGQRHCRLLADGVGEAHVGEARRGDGEEAKDRDGDQPGRHDGVAKAPVVVGCAAVEPDQRAREHDELGGEVGGAQQPRGGGGVEGVLDRAFDRQARRVLERDDPARVLACRVEVADEQPTGEVVDDVDGEEERQLRAPALPPSHGGVPSHGERASSRGRW